MDPRKQECRSLFLYGSGYYANEDEAKKRVTGRRASFCAECPARRRCEKEHVLRVSASRPEEVERYERRVAEGKRRGVSPTLLQAAMMQAGIADPFLTAALVNFQRGMGERGLLFDPRVG